MKRIILAKSLVVVAILGLFLTFALATNAQQGQKWMSNSDQKSMSNCKIPNLTEDQQKKMDELRVKHMKEVTPLRNELNEKNAHLQTLESAEKLDMDAINKTIDDISSIKAKLMKSRIAHRAEVLSILTDEQKVFYNSHRAHRGKGRGMRSEMGNGMGSGRHAMRNERNNGDCMMSN